MKILLLSPGTDVSRKTRTGLMIPQLALHILAGLTPPEHEVKIVEEEIEDIDLEEPCDLVGISCMTSNAPRAYYLAGEFKRRGKTVVLGGVHPTLLPEEALAAADAVVQGEAEGVWEQLLADFAQGRLQPRYHGPSPSLERYIPLHNRQATRKRLFNVLPVMSTRGCPYSCEFCCVSDLFGKKIRHVPVANVVRDIEESGGKIFIFLDDNIIGNPAYAKALFAAIKPLKIKWVGQASISFVRDTHLMELAVQSGCAALFFGVESVLASQMQRMRKAVKTIPDLEAAIKKVRDMGIHFHASFVFGFDDDTPAVFPETLEFLQKTKIATASINVLTPYPGTRLYEQFKAEGRLLSTDWKYYDHNTVVFRPKHMSPYELQTGVNWVKREFTRLRAIFGRLPANWSHPWLFLAMNLAARKSKHEDPARLPELITKVFTPSAGISGF